MLAQRLGIDHLDTGAMYRAVAHKLIEIGAYDEGIIIDDRQLEGILQHTSVHISIQDGVQKVYLDGDEVTDEIRRPHMAKITSSVVSVHPIVRHYITKLQREAVVHKSYVLDGRDIGTVVLPNADYKFFITASIDVRVARRKQEMQDKGYDVDLLQLREDIVARDIRDSNRAHSPLLQAQDAVLIDTTEESIEQSLQRLLQYINNVL
jgi:cytidylate kinase